MPAFGEAGGLPDVHRALVGALDRAPFAWWWWVVDDASTDGTPSVLAELAAADPRVGHLRLERRSGAHAAVLAGLIEAARRPEVDAVAVLAADLQDPPEVVTKMVVAASDGAGVILAGKRRPTAPTPGLRLASVVLHGLLGRLLGSDRYPPGGVDVVLVRRGALQRLAADPRPIGNVFVRIARLQVPLATLVVAKEARRRGRSRWTTRARIRLAIASLTEALGAPWPAVRLPLISHRQGSAAVRDGAPMILVGDHAPIEAANG
jgi:glycosyltransferase involved in cell wall biosynthesis